jgi:hypothetical protein
MRSGLVLKTQWTETWTRIAIHKFRIVQNKCFHSQMPQGAAAHGPKQTTGSLINACNSSITKPRAAAEENAADERNTAPDRTALLALSG